MRNLSKHRLAALLIAALAATAGALPTGCESGPAGSGATATPSDHIGTLRSGQMAIGGETTGWVLKRPRQPDLDVDVSKVQTEAESLDGMRVKIRGRVQERNYVERGRVPVLIAERVELAD